MKVGKTYRITHEIKVHRVFLLPTGVTGVVSDDGRLYLSDHGVWEEVNQEFFIPGEYYLDSSERVYQRQHPSDPGEPWREGVSLVPENTPQRPLTRLIRETEI